MPTDIAIERGYIKLDVIDENTPNVDDCNDPEHFGRMVIQSLGDESLWICAESGWRQLMPIE